MLIAKPKFLADESPISVLLRAADLNGWPTAQSMLVLCNPLVPILSDALRSRERYIQYVSRLGIDVPDKFGPYPRMRVYGEKGFEIRSGAGLPEWAFRSAGSVFCPICICEDENPYLRHIWQIKIFRTCQNHGCFLVEVCDKCSGPLTQNRSAPHRCTCGFDLRYSKREYGDSDTARTIHELISFGSHDRLNVFVRSYCSYVDALGIEGNSSAQDFLLGVLNNGGDSIPAMLGAKIKNTVNVEHPRIALLPVLRVTSLKKLAQSVLHELSDLTIPEKSESPPCGDVTLTDAAVVLGISDTQTILSLCHERFLEITKFHLTRCGRMAGIFISRASCDALLRNLWRHVGGEEEAQMRPRTVAVLDFVLNLLHYPADNAGYNLESGLSSLRMLGTKKPRDSMEIIEASQENFVTYEHAAALLAVGKYAISSLVKLGWLTGGVDPAFPVRKIVSRKSISEFSENHICSVSLAKEIGSQATGNFLSTLKASGIFPVGGPGIDGAIICIFRRADFGDINILKSMLAKTRVEQRKFNRSERSKNRLETTISLVVVMSSLGITLPEAKKLVNRGLLCRVQTSSIQVMVSKISFDSYFDKWTDDNLILRRDAAAMVKERENQFALRWVASGIVRSEDLGLKVCIHFNEIEKIKEIKHRYVSAADCKNMWRVRNSTLPNLEKRGLINSTRLGLRRQVRLYLRHEVETLLGPIRAQERDG